MSRKPRRHRRCFPVREEVNDAAVLQVADHRAVALPTLPGEVVDADYLDGSGHRWRTAAQHAQQRVATHRKHKPTGEAGGGPASESQAEVVDQILEPGRASGHAGCDAVRKQFAEDPSGARGGSAPEPAHLDAYVDSTAVRRQVRQPPIIPAVDL